MPFDAQVIRVMIVSPGDVLAEREIIRSVLDEWNAIYAERWRQVLLTSGCDNDSSSEERSEVRTIIDGKSLAACDVLVAVFWTRVGSYADGSVTASVEAIEEQIRNGKQVLLYFSSAPPRADRINKDQNELMREFKMACRDKGLVEEFNSAIEFHEKLSRQLRQRLCLSFPAPESQVVFS